MEGLNVAHYSAYPLALRRKPRLTARGAQLTPLLRLPSCISVPLTARTSVHAVHGFKLALRQGIEMQIEQRTIEIRAGEGGCDARIFVAELARAYIRLAEARD